MWLSGVQDIEQNRVGPKQVGRVLVGKLQVLCNDSSVSVGSSIVSHAGVMDASAKGAPDRHLVSQGSYRSTSGQLRVLQTNIWSAKGPSDQHLVS